ncbi:MAG: SBBP repeat-containing protein, partial [Ardenticatenaceae bacterium]
MARHARLLLAIFLFSFLLALALAPARSIAAPAPQPVVSQESSAAGLRPAEMASPFVESFGRIRQWESGSDLRYYYPLEGSGTDYGWDVAVDGDGNAYVTGMTDSSDFPTTPGAYDTSYNGNSDAYVVKISADGSELLYATFIGGSALDQGSKIAVDDMGNAYVAGYTYSADFPTTPGAFDPEYNGGDFDAFVVKLNASGDALSYASYLGASGADFANGIAVHGDGSAFITGYTESADFPATEGAYDNSYNGGGDIMVVRVSPPGDVLAYA